MTGVALFRDDIFDELCVGVDVESWFIRVRHVVCDDFEDQRERWRELDELTPLNAAAREMLAIARGR